MAIDEIQNIFLRRTVIVLYTSVAIPFMIGCAIVYIICEMGLAAHNWIKSNIWQVADFLDSASEAWRNDDDKFR